MSTLDLNNPIIFLLAFTSQTRRQYQAGGSRRGDGGGGRWERGLGMARDHGGVDNGLCGRVLCDQAVYKL